MSRVVVAIKDMSAGNAETGEAWQETKIFDSSDTIDNILKWAMGDAEYEMKMHTRKRITITVPHD